MNLQQQTAYKGPMDKNDFDDWLKEKLHRDIIFRMVVWSVLSLSAGYFAINGTGNSSLVFLKRMSDSTSPLINTFGLAALLLCILALALKDVEATSANPATVRAMKGKLGGFVRRGAGDLSLWALGAINTMICAVVLVFMLEPLTASDKTAGIGLAFFLSVMFFFLAVGNVLVRRHGPSPIVTSLTLPPGLIHLMWVVIAIGAVVVSLWEVIKVAVSALC